MASSSRDNGKYNQANKALAKDDHENKEQQKQFELDLQFIEARLDRLTKNVHNLEKEVRERLKEARKIQDYRKEYEEHAARVAKYRADFESESKTIRIGQDSVSKMIRNYKEDLADKQSKIDQLKAKEKDLHRKLARAERHNSPVSKKIINDKLQCNVNAQRELKVECEAMIKQLHVHGQTLEKTKQKAVEVQQGMKCEDDKEVKESAKVLACIQSTEEGFQEYFTNALVKMETYQEDLEELELECLD